MIRRQNTEKIGDVLKKILEQQPHLQPKFDEFDIMEAWQKVLGATVKRYTTELKVKNSVLHVKLSSSVLRNELMMSKSNLVTAINKAVGKPVLTDIVFR